MKKFRGKDKFSVLIPDGESMFAIRTLHCLSQIKGIKAYILSNDPRAPIRFSRYTTQFFSQLKGQNDEGRLETIYDAVKQTKVDVILPVDEPTIRLLSLHGGALSHLTAIAPVPKAEAFDIAANKWKLAEWLKINDIPCPPTILYKTDKEFEQRLSGMPFPVLIKPTQQRGGKGIEYFDNPSEVLRFCKEHVGSAEFIVQSFIRGYDIDCNVLCKEGKILAYTIQKGFMAATHHFAASVGIDFLSDSSVYNLVRELVDKISWSGIAHLDLRYDEKDKQVKVIEINPRFWQTVIGSMTTGVNFPHLACLSGLRYDLPQITFQPKRFVMGKAAIRMLMQRVARREREAYHFDSTSLEYELKDPLPRVFEAYFKVCKKLSSVLFETKDIP